VLAATAPATLALLLAGCTLARLDVEVKDFDASTVLVGRVEAPGPSHGLSPGPVVVGAWAQDGTGWRLAHQTRLHEAGGYELIVPHGMYRLFAFADGDGNGLHDAPEPTASVPGLVTANPGQPIVAGLDMVLGTSNEAPPRLVAAAAHSTQAGALADLDAPPFSAARGELGYWQPMAFFRAQGGNVYFVEPYAAHKTPVLFVHGAGGSPQDWRQQIAALDRARYQPWIFFYPSGAPVESMASLLGWKLLNLQLRHRYDRLVIVAHSMGGLVVRRFLLDQGAALPQIRRFVSISTPWAGESTADTGVAMSPAVVPSWRDMQPDGPLLRSLFERRLPAGVEFDLLFGYRGGYSLWRPNHDGTVTLASQLRREAQQEAKAVVGFDDDHASILRSPQVAAQLRTLLEAGADESARARLEVRLGFDGAAPRGLPVLVLEPEAGDAHPLTTVLAATEGGGRVGPLPPGRYRAGLIAPGFAAEPRVQPVAIGDDGTASLSFRLRPDGSLNGFVQSALAIPAGSFGAPGTPPAIRSITLRGAGLERRLVPRAGTASLLRMAAGEDDAVGANFMFCGLVEGEYELTIVADGHAAHRSRHRVVPGEPPPIAAIRLGDPR
jgi:pimeloyl-ACP methyl ester carboxylesterase